MDYVLLKIWIFDGLCYLLKAWIFVLMDFVLYERYGYYDFCCFIWNMNVLFAVKRKKEIKDERNECIISSCGLLKNLLYVSMNIIGNNRIEK